MAQPTELERLKSLRDTTKLLIELVEKGEVFEGQINLRFIGNDEDLEHTILDNEPRANRLKGLYLEFLKEDLSRYELDIERKELYS